MWPIQTSWANVLVQAPELANAASLQSTPAQNLFLQDAANWLNPNVWGAKVELGQRLLACHLATMSLRRGAGGNISAVGAGPAKISYSVPAATDHSALSYSQTSYGIEFQRVMKTLPAARFAVGSGFGGVIPFSSVGNLGPCE